MDINGAKALKKRLSLNGAGEATRAPADAADISNDAPPVYHWLGVPQPRETPPEDDPASNASLFRRLGLSFR